MTDDIHRLWERRIESLGRAQSRYLWILLVTGLFFWSLRPSSGLLTATPPLLPIELDTRVLEAASPSVLFILVMVALGALAAYGVAFDEWMKGRSDQPQSEHEKDLQSEALDAVPNALDLTVYMLERFHRSLKILMLLAYPAYVSIFTYEGIRLWWRLITASGDIAGRSFFLLASTVLGFIATMQVIAFWRRRLTMISDRFSGRSQSAS